MQLPEGVKMTPMLKQYMQSKERYPDCMLLFRMGDFFEMFFDDAETASRVLGITLTARDPDRAIPMAGVPHHALDSYIGKLIAAGYRAAICDQTSEPDGRGIVERNVVRVVTPGTYAPQESTFDGRLAAVSIGPDSASIALLSASTGALSAGTFPLDEAVSETASFEPGELLVPKGQEERAMELFASSGAPFVASRAVIARDRQEFAPLAAAKWLCRRWDVATLKSMGLDDADPAAGSAAAALRYLEETQFSAADHVHEITPIVPGSAMLIDRATQLNLELVDGDSSLLSVIDRTRTPAGRRLLREQLLAPCADIDEINFRQDCVEALARDVGLMSRIASALSACRDIERAIGRLSLGTGNPKDVGAVRDTLSALPIITNEIASSEDGHLKRLVEGIPDLSELTAMLDAAVADDPPRLLSAGGVVREGWDAELDDLRDAIKNAEANLRDFEASERERTGIRVRVGINKVFGHYIEVGKSYLDRVPDDYIRRQTVASGERFVNERLKEIERRVTRAEFGIGEREAALYAEIVSRILSESRACQEASAIIAKLDMIHSFASIARDMAYVRPVIDDSRAFSVKNARHPVVERALGGAAFTPNDIELDPDASNGRGSVAIITGPNMAGKSTYLRSAALVAVMAHTGSFIPAESAHIGRIDRIFTRLGARDELARGRSTFMVEMVETANILRHVGARSLVVLDEVGRGTSTYDGMSIAWAVVEFLCLHVEGGTKALFATHYHELTNISLPMLVNLSMAIEESGDSIRFLHKVVDGPADRSYGVEVAKLAGVPSLVIKRSQELLDKLEDERRGDGERFSQMSKRYAQREIFFDVEREGVIEQLSQCDPDHMTPMEALDLVFKLRQKSRKILGLS